MSSRRATPATQAQTTPPARNYHITRPSPGPTFQSARRVFSANSAASLAVMSPPPQLQQPPQQHSSTTLTATPFLPSSHGSASAASPIHFGANTLNNANVSARVMSDFAARLTAHNPNVQPSSPPRQQRGQVSSASVHPQFRSKAVCELFCRHCDEVVCTRGMKAILLGDTRVELFSTDSPPCRVQLVENDYMTRNCQCRIRDVACLQCGNVIGYHVTQPCEVCLDSCNNGHFWMFLSEGVKSKDRQHFTADQLEQFNRQEALVGALAQRRNGRVTGGAVRDVVSLKLEQGSRAVE
ncbi:Protein fam72b [Chytriomyces hyalinus]|nr:Protein fam72b [Chytriomyces hyalinus]